MHLLLHPPNARCIQGWIRREPGSRHVQLCQEPSPAALRAVCDSGVELVSTTEATPHPRREFSLSGFQALFLVVAKVRPMLIVTL